MLIELITQKKLIRNSQKAQYNIQIIGVKFNFIIVFTNYYILPMESQARDQYNIRVIADVSSNQFDDQQQNQQVQLFKMLSADDYQPMQQLAVEVDIDMDQYQDHYQLNVPTLQSQSSQFSQPPILSYSYSGISNASSTPEFVMHSSRVSEQIPHFMFMKAQKLFTSIQKLINQLKQILCLQDDISLYLLYKYKWNKQKLLEQYYNSSQVYRQINKKIQTLKSSKIQQKAGVCSVCTQETKLVKNVLCQHAYCAHCWKYYIKEKLGQGQIFFTCMHKCANSFVLFHAFVEKFVPEFFQLYRKILCINYTNTNKSISYCPSQKKQCDIFCERSQSQYDVSVQCQCGQVYCFFCRKQTHHPATCQDVVKWQKLLNDQSSNCSWISKNTKSCPSCKNPVEKFIGCSKIKCTCGVQFCYDCNAKWDSNHKSVKGQCSSLKRKSSLQERSSTTDFIKLQQKSLAITRTLKKNIATIDSIFEYIKQQWILNKFHGLRKQITDSWQALKWGCIISFIYKKAQVQSFVQEQFIESIMKLMDCLEKLQAQGMPSLICSKDAIAIGEQTMIKRQIMRKNKDLWFEAWRSS